MAAGSFSERSISSSSSDSEFSDDYSFDGLNFDEDKEHISDSNDRTEIDTLQTIGMGIIPYQYEPQIDEGDTENIPVFDPAAIEDREERLRNTNWCTCDNCSIMDSVKESICCQEILKVLDKSEEDNPSALCITSHTDFRAVCLNKGVLDTAYFQYRQQYTVNIKRQDDSATPGQQKATPLLTSYNPPRKYSAGPWPTRSLTGLNTRKYRHVAYRQLVRWCWGYLGKEVRRPLPSCAVTLIRNTFPSPDGLYKGFQLE